MVRPTSVVFQDWEAQMLIDFNTDILEVSILIVISVAVCYFLLILLYL